MRPPYNMAKTSSYRVKSTPKPFVPPLQNGSNFPPPPLFVGVKLHVPPPLPFCSPPPSPYAHVPCHYLLKTHGHVACHYKPQKVDFRGQGPSGCFKNGRSPAQTCPRGPVGLPNYYRVYKKKHHITWDGCHGEAGPALPIAIISIFAVN